MTDVDRDTLLFVIDMQNDFLGETDGSPFAEMLAGGRRRTAALPVPGGVEAGNCLARFIETREHLIANMLVAFDSHRRMHSANPGALVDARGTRPKPFTLVSTHTLGTEWVVNFEDPEHRLNVKRYVAEQERRGKAHIVWPEHCIVGTWGHNLFEPLDNAIAFWERSARRSVENILKGQPLVPEFFSAIEAEVVDENDPATQPNKMALKRCEDARVIVIAGLALDYCVAATARHIQKHLGDAVVKKFVFFTDCTAAIDKLRGEEFLAEMKALGATITTSRAYRS